MNIKPTNFLLIILFSLIMPIAAMEMVPTYSDYALSGYAETSRVTSNEREIVPVPWAKRATNFDEFYERLTTLLPQEITLLQDDEAITDELLNTLNPQWTCLKDTFSDQQKRGVWTLSGCINRRRDYHRARTFAALVTFYFGENPSPENIDANFAGDDIMQDAVNEQDYYLARYLLEKGSNQNDRRIWGSLPIIRSVAFAELLIEHGAKIRRDIFRYCCSPHYPFELMEFYHSLGARPCENTNQPPLMHLLIGFGISDDHQLRKAKFLLQNGISACIRNKNSQTIFHNLQVCLHTNVRKFFLNHFIESHGLFLEILMQLRRDFPRFYRQKDVLKLCFEECSLLGMKQLKTLLNAPDANSKRPYDIQPIAELNPENCRYEKLQDLVNTHGN